MAESTSATCIQNYGSKALNEMVQKLKTTSDSRRRYEYVLWLAKKLPDLPKELRTESRKVKGCVSEVFVLGEMTQGRIKWLGYSDALITRGLLAFLINGLNDLTPNQIRDIDPDFLSATGLQGSLTPSRANGFLNIFMMMQLQAKDLASKN
ncbi:MAG: SufE family protein [Prochlorococcaceae cyanobacterium ETNP1_MAG_9]|nr:SufE family protein [Prochlorococcaceae cyanobacterium ETNP1_MAG_9]